MAIINKRSSGTNLLATASWGTGTGPVPGTGDTATWITGSLGGSLTNATSWSVGAIDVQAATAAISISTANVSVFGNITVASGGVNLTFNSSTLSIAAASVVWSVGSGRTLSVGTITTNGNTYAVSLNGAGTTVFRSAASGVGSSTFSISNGVVQVGNATALGGASNTITMTGGKLSSSSTTGYTLANALTLNGTMTLGDGTNTGALTFSGATSISGNSTLTISSDTVFSGAINGTGVNLTVAGAALSFTSTAATGTFNGVFTTSGSLTTIGAISSGTPNQLANASRIVITGGQFLVAGGNLYTFATPVIGSTGTFYVRNSNASGITFTGDPSALTPNGFTGVFQLYADGGESAATTQLATFTLASQAKFSILQFSTFTGAAANLRQTWKYTGTSSITSTSTIGIAPYTTGLVGVVDNSSSNASAVSFSGAVQLAGTQNGTLETAATLGNITLSGDITETVAFTLGFIKSGPFTTTLSGANTFKGSVQVTTGTLNATTSATALGSTSGGAISVTSGATLSLGVAPTYTGRSLTIGGTGVSSTVGALVIANAGTNQFQSILLGSPTNYIRATSSGISEINALFTTNNNSIILGAASNVYFRPFSSNTFSQIFSGTGSVTYGSHSLDTGDVETGGEHDYTGNTTLAFGTTYVPSSREIPGTSGPFGKTISAGSLRMTGGILRYSNGNYDYSGRFSTAGSQQWRIDTASSSVTFATALVGASSLSLMNGALTLSSSASTFSSGVNLIGGTLNLGAQEIKTGLGVPISGPLGLTGTITFTGGTLQYSSVNQNDYSIRFATSDGQNRKIDTNGQSVTFASSLGGINSLELVGLAGTLTLAVANTYTQGTTISVGTLKAGNTTALGTGAVIISASGATLQTLTSGFVGQNGKLTVASLNNAAGGIIKIGG